MKLPHRNRAEVPKSKLLGYLLAPDHVTGADKARYFAGLGYTRANWQDFRRALLTVGRSGEAVLTVSTDYGKKYIVDPSKRGSHV